MAGAGKSTRRNERIKIAHVRVSCVRHVACNLALGKRVRDNRRFEVIRDVDACSIAEPQRHRACRAARALGRSRCEATRVAVQACNPLCEENNEERGDPPVAQRSAQWMFHRLRVRRQWVISGVRGLLRAGVAALDSLYTHQQISQPASN